MWETNSNEQQQFGFLDILAVIGFTMQMANYQENSKQSSNDDLMREMKKQDVEYFEKIMSQNEEIIKLLNQMNN